MSLSNQPDGQGVPIIFWYAGKILKYFMVFFANWAIDGAHYTFHKNRLHKQNFSNLRILKKISLAYFHLSELIQKTQFTLTDPEHDKAGFNSSNGEYKSVVMVRQFHCLRYNFSKP